ncbi:MAG: nitroreductase family deazaflavin-dependent oxidoreductase [Chloroflexi bacterium]|nr:nitroreductase family deazaflavin-dependent oxidoreductase [Chloroflexota bacterium]
MSEYVPSPAEWVRDQVELYESTNGAEGAEMRGMPVVIVTHRGRRSGAVRKTPLMRVADGDGYVLVGSLGGAPQNPVWVHNLLADPDVEIRDRSTVQAMRARLVEDPAERERLWRLSVEAYPDYEAYQESTERVIPLFRAEPR